ncbi:MAG: hypothetical protein H6741_00220 [Alphaproteobacteria bacterium]|nr:hypothetical protein [Alphaproteobacteria bacterium]MCB9791129.1 hypothetical protein [Alphaproteobacteria bacterium]
MLLLQLLIGAVLGAVSLVTTRLTARGRPDPAFIERSAWAFYLVVAALIYVGFAVAGDAPGGWMGAELAGVAFYGAVAVAGFWRWPRLVGVGWLAHGLWDFLLHPGGHPGYVPDWYPAVCLGFDLAVGVWLVRALGDR